MIKKIVARILFSLLRTLDWENDERERERRELNVD
jgi:hypothetical protein